MNFVFRNLNRNTCDSGVKTDSHVTIRVCFVFPCLFGMEGQEPLVWLVAVSFVSRSSHRHRHVSCAR